VSQARVSGTATRGSAAVAEGSSWKAVIRTAVAVALMVGMTVAVTVTVTVVCYVTMEGVVTEIRVPNAPYHSWPPPGR
jgi:hypothetical protein